MIIVYTGEYRYDEPIPGSAVIAYLFTRQQEFEFLSHTHYSLMAMVRFKDVGVMPVGR